MVLHDYKASGVPAGHLLGAFATAVGVVDWTLTRTQTILVCSPDRVQREQMDQEDRPTYSPHHPGLR